MFRAVSFTITPAISHSLYLPWLSYHLRWLSYRPRWPRQVQSRVAVTDGFAYKCLQCKRSIKVINIIEYCWQNCNARLTCLCKVALYHYHGKWAAKLNQMSLGDAKGKQIKAELSLYNDLKKTVDPMLNVEKIITKPHKSWKIQFTIIFLSQKWQTPFWNLHTKLDKILIVWNFSTIL